MASGINNSYPLILSIAIPTWNRASTLDQALKFLLPQVYEFKQHIQIVISDNASDDNTAEIVNKHLLKYSSLFFIYNQNEVNIGFFGNFKKCRELSSGKYLWILSDDDFVCDNIVFEVINNLIKGDYSTIFLKNNFKLSCFIKTKLSSDELLVKESYNLGLISSVIFLNDKTNDSKLFMKYFDSPFIGFIFMLNSFNFKNLTLSVEGKCLYAANHASSVSNFFEVFVNGMEDVINYFHFSNTSSIIIKRFRIQYLVKFLLPSYILYKVYNKTSAEFKKYNSIKLVEKSISNFYSDLFYYWFLFFPLIVIPRPLLSVVLRFYRCFK